MKKLYIWRWKMKLKINTKLVGILALIITTLVIITPVYAATRTAETKAFYSASKLKNNFGSKTNPAKGTKPASNPKPAVNGFIYGDFGTFNSFASENKLGGTPIYLLGTIKSVEKFAITGDIYYAAFLIDDFEGYQWVGAKDVPKNTFDTLKTTYTGMTAYIYGAYDGYSIDLNRPIINIGLITDATGMAVTTPAAITVQAPVTTQVTTITPTTVTTVSDLGQPAQQVQNTTPVVNDTMVWLSATGSKYHRINKCGNMNPDKARQVTLSEAASKYEQCSDCW